MSDTGTQDAAFKAKIDTAEGDFRSQSFSNRAGISCEIARSLDSGKPYILRAREAGAAVFGYVEICRFSTPTDARTAGEALTAVKARLCDYCQEAPATVYFAAYDSYACEPCHDDHYGS